jgi:hypothetical protein
VHYLEKAMARSFVDRHLQRLIARYSSDQGRFLPLLLIAALIPTILILDRSLQQASLGILYTIPMLLASVSMREREIAVLALFCAILSWWGDPSASRIDGAMYFIFSFISYLCVAYFATTLLRSHRMAIENLNSVEKERALRCEAEEQLTTLVESSPAAILTLDEEGACSRRMRRPIGYLIFRMPTLCKARRCSIIFRFWFTPSTSM